MSQHDMKIKLYLQTQKDRTPGNNQGQIYRRTW